MCVTAHAEVMGSNPAQAWIFFEALISQLLSFVCNCDDQSLINTHVKSWKVWLFNLILQLENQYLHFYMESSPVGRVCIISQSISKSKVTLVWTVNMIFGRWSWIFAYSFDSKYFIIQFQCDLFLFFFFFSRLRLGTMQALSCYCVLLILL